MSSVAKLRIAGALALLLPALAGIAAQTPSARPAADLDRILAVVNEDVITESELSARLAQTKQQLTFDKIKLPTDAELRRQLLEHMVMERVQLQLAERAGIKIPDAEVDQAIEKIAAGNKMSVPEFRRMLERSGLKPQAHTDEIRAQLAIRQLLDREINARVTVSDSEVADFLEAHPQGTDAEYNLSHIFLPLPESPTPEQIQAGRKRADDIRQQLKQGANFEQLAVTHSKGEGALSGGTIGWKKAGQLPDLFVAALKDLAPGAVSEPLRSASGFHILKLNQRRGESVMANVAQTHVRHILMRGSEIQSLEDARIKLANLRNRIEHGEDFATLAKANSEDPGSAASGGDLGWVSPSMLVPEFERAMDALKPGQLSQPVASPFGLHLIQVLERRTRDMSEENVRNNARKQIHARKATEQYQQWLRQVRDEAFVEYPSGEE
jgi:peptidyl-prolyl cis-trans isomerase SurA